MIRILAPVALLAGGAAAILAILVWWALDGRWHDVGRWPPDDQQTIPVMPPTEAELTVSRETRGTP